jgi:sarcosine oxidase subunit gamma
MVQVAAQKGNGARTGDMLTRTLGLAPPPPNRAAGVGALSILWVGSERWLVVEPRGRDLHRALHSVLPDDVAAVVDLSQSRTCLRVAGPTAYAVLAKGCALDFHRRTRPAGHAAQSTVAGINALIHVIATETAFDLYIARSFARSFWEWFTDAAAEHGYEVAPAGT